MAEAEQLDGAEGEVAEEGAPKGGKKGLILIIVAALVLAGGGAGAGSPSAVNQIPMPSKRRRTRVPSFRRATSISIRRSS